MIMDQAAMTGFEKTVLFLMASFFVCLLMQPVISTWGLTLRKRVCIFKQKYGSSFYLRAFTMKKGQLTYVFSGEHNGSFSHRIEPQHMKLLIEKVRTLRDDIETGSYYINRPYQEQIGNPNRGKLYFGPTHTVFKRYGFISYLSRENEQKYHHTLFDIFICDEPEGHLAFFKPLGDPEISRLIRFSLPDMKKTCDHILDAFERDFVDC